MTDIIKDEPIVEPIDEPIDEPTKEPVNTFTQDDVNNIVAKNVKGERAKLLKDLGIEDVENAKQALDEYKKLKDAQKSELEKLQESDTEKSGEIEKLKGRIAEFETKQRIEKVLTEKEIDLKYAQTINKLLNVAEITDDDKEFIALVDKTIKEFLPDLQSEKAMGFGQTQSKPPKGTKNHMDKKYGNNPFYGG